jgi:hypothetical protein
LVERTASIRSNEATTLPSASDVVEPALTAAFVADRLEEAQRVGNPPAGVGSDPQCFCPVGSLGSPSYSSQRLSRSDAHLDERRLHVQGRRRDDAADGAAELGDQPLLGLGMVYATPSRR